MKVHYICFAAYKSGFYGHTVFESACRHQRARPHRKHRVLYKLFRVEPPKVRTDYAKFEVSNPPLNFTLNQQPFEAPGALSHLGFQVASTKDVLAVREQWHQAGLVTRDEMQTNCCYATQDKTWVKDPDGNEWEVFVVLQDNLPEQAVKALPEELG